MRVLLVIASLGSLVAIMYLSASGSDCEAELSACLSDPPLFVKLKGADANTYCLVDFKACVGHSARTSVEKAAAIAAAKQKAADAALFTQTVGFSNSRMQPTEPFDLATDAPGN